MELTPDGLAELELKIDDDWAPLPAGTHAEIRQFGLSGPASRYIELQLPDGATHDHLDDGAVLPPDQTTSNVDLDEVFATFDARTRRALRGVFRGSARQYAGEGRNAAAGWLYLDPSLVAATRLFDEVNRDSDELRRFVRETAHLVGDVAEKREDLAGLVDNLADTTGAITRPEGALAEAIERLPPFLRQANTTYVNLRATLDDVEPLVETAKPVAKKLLPYTRELRGFVTDLKPTVNDLAPVLRRPGPSNDLVELMRSDTAAARHRGRARAAQRRGARGRAAGRGRGTRRRDAADRVRAAVLGRLHRLARRLLALGQRRRDGRLRPDRDARERVLAQERRALAAVAGRARRHARRRCS